MASVKQRNDFSLEMGGTYDILDAFPQLMVNSILH